MDRVIFTGVEFEQIPNQHKSASDEFLCELGFRLMILLLRREAISPLIPG